MSVDSNCQYRFSRELNLLIESDLMTFMQESKRAGYHLPINTEKELRELIEFGRHFLTDAAFYLRNDNVQIYIRPKMSVGYYFFEDILPLVSFLYKFRDGTNFINKVRVKTDNLGQLDDTIFELKCLKQFYENGCSFEYEPRVNIKGKEKEPDFRLTKNRTDIFVECKQVGIGKTEAEVLFIEQFHDALERFPEDIVERLNDQSLRLEVNFIKTPTVRDINTLVKKVCDNFLEIRGSYELPVEQISDNLEYIILRQNKSSPFSNKAIVMKAGRLNVGIKPTLIHNQGNINTGGIIFYSAELFRKRRKDIVRLIREAKNQLPDGEHGMIILGKANLTIAKQEVKKRMNGNQYMSILAFIVNPFEKFQSCYRTQYRELLFDLFEGFQPQNPFK